LLKPNSPREPERARTTFGLNAVHGRLRIIHAGRNHNWDFHAVPNDGDRHDKYSGCASA